MVNSCDKTVAVLSNYAGTNYYYANCSQTDIIGQPLQSKTCDDATLSDGFTAKTTCIGVCCGSVC
jgi:hypothetical protein